MIKEGLKEKRYTYIWLILGGILLVFYNGRWTIPLATWLSFVFIVRVYRQEKTLKGILLPLFIYILSTFVSFKGVIFFQGYLYYLALIGLGVVYFIPFIIDRILYNRVKGFKATLILPLVGVIVEYIVSIFNPFATWGSLAYTQYGVLPIMQLGSITGIWGISFLIYWFYSFVNWVWENEFRIDKVKRGALVFVSILVVIFLMGGLRNTLLEPNSETVRIASITVPTSEFFNDTDLNTVWHNQQATTENKALAKEKLEKLHRKLITLTQREAEAGAKIILWHEANGLVLKEDEDAFIQAVSEVAEAYKTYTMMSLFTITPGEDKAVNQSVLIDPSGGVLFKYVKGKPVPGELSKKGDGVIETADTPYGTIGTVICYDADFPNYMRQAGKKNVDIMLIPASDWKEIDPIHTYMATFRGVENGFNYVRQTNLALSLSGDYQGRQIASMDYYHTEDRVMISHLPTKGTKTIYSILGDFLPYLAIIGLIGILRFRH